MNAQAPLPWLVADIGGTNARFALVPTPDSPPLAIEALRCAEFPDPAAAIEHYLAQTSLDRPRSAALAVAAPVTGDRIDLTNHPWTFSIEALRQSLQFDRLRVLNDFTALALALPHLAPGERRQVGPGEPAANAPLALIGPGTGLGVSALLPTDGRWLPLSGEGGHVTMAPIDARESAILDQVRQRFPHVSGERLICGSGLCNLYRALAELEGKPVESLEPAAITQRALDGSDPLCVETLNTFCGMLGTLAGNLVLTLGASGGLYIGGGIVPRLGGFIDHSPFRQQFAAKGRYAEYLAQVPSYVITAPYPALIGTARALAGD
ncbi:MAG: glucokinase [Candidatus Competibacterales bacterium]|nr:glucokinase [Candidatus Competibacterales bacterium]